ncbi:gamma-glutamylcyclotransferase family protein [Mesorhizobium sp. B3-1-9]|uniref:gamma-glutamylcyclotransferase family protein n=1 Tax=Mesorhizobium sp. B3-1-9 TaxID=2589892 RepID=UPI001FED9837|nr:gamma-glutamylcyclotransferase family protein [Mesorhizobium sp. B3-1-9]
MGRLRYLLERTNGCISTNATGFAAGQSPSIEMSSRPLAENVFVFGTLKRGFPLHDEGLSGARFIGPCRTKQRYPMLIAGPRFAPMMFNEPGSGLHVSGELYIVDECVLAKLDSIESIGKPGNFRILIEIDPVADGSSTLAHVYMKSRSLADPIQSGLLDRYEDRRFIREDPAKPGPRCCP